LAILFFHAAQNAENHAPITEKGQQSLSAALNFDLRLPVFAKGNAFIFGIENKMLSPGRRYRPLSTSGARD
jgi:hypothetical protein